MPIDMFLRRFLQELRAVPRFEREGAYDHLIQAARLPPGRAAFTALCLIAHNAGYRLPSYPHFRDTYLKAIFGHGNYARSFRHCFDHVPGTSYALDVPKPGLAFRMSQWYDDGMAHLQLYAALAEIIEDVLKVGVVQYDTRVDWKLKADVVVLSNGRNVVVSSFFDNGVSRKAVERGRDRRERDAKANTPESAHWDNRALAATPKVEISRSEADHLAVNGVRLYTPAALDRLLARIADAVGVPDIAARSVLEICPQLADDDRRRV